LCIFQENPLSPQLKNHVLKWDKNGLRAISAGFDLRILYREEWGHAIVFLIKTGTHNQVY
jgi:mRNA-degrading endonuclease YafQ of YafQ-DinJ toxin-antitoxin module